MTAASSTQLTVTVPANIGTRGVSVTAGGNTSALKNFTINGSLHYVDAAAGGANNGTSWTNAFTSLSAAITAASGTCGDSIWVKAGTYKPGAARANSFTLKGNVTIFGGFAGTENDLGQRNITTNVTILDGDVTGNDNANIINTEATRAENNHHVVTGVTNGYIDGFTVQGGNANTGGGFNDHAGGMYNDTISNLVVRNMTFRNNTASVRGGGMYNNSVTGLTLTDSTFNNNHGGVVGGGIANCPGAGITYTFNRLLFTGNNAFSGGGMGNQCSGVGGKIIVNNSVFSNNTGTNGGGYSDDNSVESVLNNVVFTGNSVGGEGGAILVGNTSPTVPQNMTLNNVTIFNNTATGGGGAIKTGGNAGCTNNLTINNSVIWSDTFSQLGGINNWTFNNSIIAGLAGLTLVGNTNNLDSDPLFVNSGDPDGADNIFRTTDDGLQLGVGSPAINRGAAGAGIPTTDIIGTTRTGNPDAGAYEP